MMKKKKCVPYAHRSDVDCRGYAVGKNSNNKKKEEKAVCAHRSESNYYAMRTVRYTTNAQLNPDWNITKTTYAKMRQNTKKKENC